MKTSIKHLLIIIILGLVVFCVIFFNGFVGDDNAQTISNLLVASITNIPHFFAGGTEYDPLSHQITATYYRPLMSSFFTIIISLFGPQAFFLHFFQVLLYITNACLVYLVLRKFLKENIAVILSIIFLVHPINAEVASYISDTQDVLFFFFGILAACVLLYKWQHKKKIEGESYQNSFLILLANILVLMSMLSKETGVLFVIPILYIVILNSKNDLNRKFSLIFSSSLTCLVMVVYLMLYLQVKMSPYSNPDLPIGHASLITYLQTAPKILFFYIQTFIFPLKLAVLHTWVVTKVTFSNFYFPLIVDVLFIAAIVFLGVVYWKRKEGFWIYLFFALWLIAGLAFHSNFFFKLDGTVSERWFYFPFFGLLGLIGMSLEALPTRLYSKYTRSFFVGLLVIIVLLSLRTVIRTTNFSNNMTLYAHDSKVENDPYLESNYSMELLYEGKYKEAENEANHSVMDYPQGIINRYNLALLYEDEGKIKEAEQELGDSMKNGIYPGSYEEYAKLLTCYSNQQKAADFIRSALVIIPNDYALQQYLNYSVGIPIPNSNWKRFVSNEMNLTFTYPLGYKILNLSTDKSSLLAPDEIGIFECSQDNLQEPTLLIYSQLSADETDLDTFGASIAQGEILNKSTIRDRNFGEAQMEIYHTSQGNDEILLFANEKQMFVVEMPLSEENLNSSYSQILNKIIGSIKTL